MSESQFYRVVIIKPVGSFTVPNLEEPVTVNVGVYADSKAQFAPFTVMLQIDNEDYWKSKQELPLRREIMAGLMQDSAAKVKTRFWQSADIIDDLDIIIALCRKAAVLTPQTHSNYPRAMSDLANALEDRYRHLLDPTDWDHIIAIRQTLILVRLDPSHLKKLADAFATRYRILGKKKDLDGSIRFFKKTLDFRPTRSADRIKALGLLAQLLALRYRHYHQMKDLNQAIKFQGYAYYYPHDDDDDDDVLRVDNLREYIGLLHTRFLKSKDQAQALQIIAFTERIIERGQETSTDLRRISEALHARFGHSSYDSGSPERGYLELAVSYQLQGLNLQEPDDPDRGDGLVNLGCILRSLFLHTENRKYLDEAIGFLREGLELFPSDHRDRPQVLFYLSRALREHFRQTNQHEFLRESLDLGKAAMESAHLPRKVRPRVLSNLADSLWAQYALASDATLKDVDAVILLREQALEEWADDLPDYLGTSNLADALRIRFFKSFDVEDLNRAHKLLHAHMVSMSYSHSTVSQMSASFALAFYAAFWVSEDPEDFKEGVELFQQAATHYNAPVWQKFDAARTWAAIADQQDRNGDTSALEAYRTAIELLPRLVSITADLELRQQTLVNKPTINGLPLYAAGYAIKADKLQDAINFLEEGRAVFWNQAIKLRTPVADLEHKHPELAKKFRRVSKALEESSFLGRQHLSGGLSLTDPTKYQQDTEKIRDLDEEWGTTLRQIRQKSGFDKFLLPHSTPSLQKCPLDGVVIMLCVTTRNSGAILITPNETKYIPLASINHTDVNKLVELVNSVAVPARKRPRLGPRPPSTSSILSHVLKELWEKMVLPIIRFLELKKSGNPLRVYWCPTGMSTFLPIHAAGVYDDLGKASESISDYIVSSYIPTLETLIKTFETPSHENVTPHKILAIAQPRSLPYALKELKIIEEKLGSRSRESLIKLGDGPSNPATIPTVLHHLTTASVVHFACHGKQIEGNPLDSGLFLEDGRLDLSRIMQMEIKNANLAFLCACETAMGERQIPDESMHLGAALLFAGFKGVIGTMWSIADRDGPKIADAFYGRLFNNQDERESRLNINVSGGARALHDAVLKLRSEGVPLQRWVPFVYFGR